MNASSPPSDVIDVRELVRSLRKGWFWWAGGAAIGLLVGMAVLLLVPPRYESTASVVLEARGGGQLNLPGMRDVAAAFSLPDPGASDFDTELEVLTSRRNAGRVVRDLGLQVRPLHPAHFTADSLFGSVAVDDEVRSADLEFRRVDDGWEVEGPDLEETIRSGVYETPGIRLELHDSGLPDDFRVRVQRLPAAVEWLREQLDVETPGGGLAELTFRSPAPATAAAVPDALIRVYLEERATEESGIDLRRALVVEEMVDSVRTELSAAVERLRRHHEGRGTFEPDRLAEVERAGELRAQADELEVELRSLNRLVGPEARDTLTVSDLAAFPTFLRNEVVNDILDRLLDLHRERSELLQRRTERDPDVRVLSDEIRHLESELLALTRSYRESVVRSLQGISEELARARTALAARPAEEATERTLEGEVERLTASYLGLQNQLVQTRLAGVRGGLTRQIDRATLPREPAFPVPVLTLAAGGATGLLLGALLALLLPHLGDRVRSARYVTLLTGLHTVSLRGETAAFPGLPSGRPITVALLALGSDGEGAKAARALARPLVLRGEDVAVVDLDETLGGAGDQFTALPGSSEVALLRSGAGPAAPEGEAAAGGPVEEAGRLTAFLREIERHASVVLALAPGLDHPGTAAILGEGVPVVLLARRGRTRMSDLDEAVRLVRGTDADLRGVIVDERPDDADGS